MPKFSFEAADEPALASFGWDELATGWPGTFWALATAGIAIAKQAKEHPDKVRRKRLETRIIKNSPVFVAIKTAGVSIQTAQQSYDNRLYFSNVTDPFTLSAIKIRIGHFPTGDGICNRCRVGPAHITNRSSKCIYVADYIDIIRNKKAAALIRRLS